MSLISDFRAFVMSKFSSNGTGDIDGTELQSALLQVAGLLEAQTSWMPVLSLVSNGPNTVVKISDWTGGVGVKPPVNVYFTGTSYSADINVAVNLRGPQGLNGLPGTGVVSAITSAADPSVQYFPILELPSTNGGTYDFAEFEVVAKPWDSGAYLPIRLKIWIANRGAFQYQWTYIGLIANNYNVVVYRLGDGRAVAYLKLDNNFKSAGVRVINHNQATVFSALIGQSSVSGTKVFDSSDTVNYPPLMAQTPLKTTLPALEVSGMAQLHTPGGNLDGGAAINIVVDGLVGDNRALLAGASSTGKAFFRSVSSSGTPGFEFYIVNTKAVDIDSSGNVGIGIAPGERLDVDGRIRSKGLIAAGAMPTISGGTGVGSGTVGLIANSTDMCGGITISTSGSPAANAALCNITFAVGYARTPRILISPNNAQSANAMPRVYARAGTTGFTLYSGLSAIDNAQSYEFTYFIIA